VGKLSVMAASGAAERLPQRFDEEVSKVPKERSWQGVRANLQLSR
jgi:hypothetical protein